MTEDGMGKSSDVGATPGSSAAAAAPVFISYASQDTDTANQICRSLEGQGISCWIAPRDVKPGAEYADVIVHAINDAKAIVLVMSAGAVASAHVGREVERAASKRKSIIAFRIDEAPLSAAFEYFLSQSQWIDVPALGMKAALAKLAKAIASGSTISARPSAPARINPKRTARRVVAVAVILIVVVAVLVGGGRLWTESRHALRLPAVNTISNKSIAVLPFADMSEKKDQEYFADGMAEEILGLLAKVPGIKVIGRTSSFQFKGQTQDLRAIGEKLGAHYILEGSVRKVGDRLRVTAQLINSRDGAHLWSQTYDRELSDVLKMQDEIAAKVARGLEVEVETRDYFVSRPALHNAEAYTLYLKASHAADRYEPEGWEQGMSGTQRALELDPTFAEAAAGLAGFYEFGGLVGYLPPAVAFEKARQAAEHAIKLDPKLASAYETLGDLDNMEWDWAAADRETKRALTLAPSDPSVLQSAAEHSLTQGRWEDALKFADAAVDLDPLDPGVYFALGRVQLCRGRLAQAEAAMHRSLELAPTLTFGPYTLGLVLLARGQPGAALAAFLKEPADAARLNGSALAYFALGRRADSDAALAQTVKNYAKYPLGIAGVYAFRGESDEAFKWLDRSYAQKETLLYHIKYAMELDGLHEDPRYKALLKKMNFPRVGRLARGIMFRAGMNPLRCAVLLRASATRVCFAQARCGRRGKCRSTFPSRPCFARPWPMTM